MNSHASAQIRALQSEREALQLRRQQLEKRYEAKLGTSKDTAQVHAHMLKRRLRRLQINQGRECPLLDRTNQVTRDVLQKIDDVVSVKHPSRVALEKEQLEYLSKIDDLYPRHQSQLEAANVRMLRDLQEEERLIAKRTADAKASFEKEITMKGLLTEQRQKVKAAKQREVALAKLRENARDEMKTNEIVVQECGSPRNNMPLVKAPETEGDVKRNEVFRQELPKLEPPIGFDWQVVSSEALLPTYLQTQTRNNGQRLARLPHTFTLRILIPEHKSVVVHARRNSSVAELIKQVEAVSQLRIDHLVLDKQTHMDGPIGQFGENLFTKGIHAVIKPSSLPWAHLALVLKRIVETLQRDSRIPELRNTKYGLIRHGGRSIDTTKVMDTFASNSDTSCSSFNVFELIATLKEVVSLQSHTLLPDSLLESTTRILDSADIEKTIQEYHTSFSDGRENTWKFLVDHWRWITRTKILTADQVANVFVEALKPDESESNTNRLWQIIEVLSASGKPSPLKTTSTRAISLTRSIERSLLSPRRGLVAASLSEESKETDESFDSSVEIAKLGTNANSVSGSGPAVLAHLEEFSDVEDDLDLLETGKEDENDTDF